MAPISLNGKAGIRYGLKRSLLIVSGWLSLMVNIPCPAVDVVVPFSVVLSCFDIKFEDSRLTYLEPSKILGVLLVL